MLPGRFYTMARPLGAKSTSTRCGAGSCRATLRQVRGAVLEAEGERRRLVGAAGAAARPQAPDGEHVGVIVGGDRPLSFDSTPSKPPSRHHRLGRRVWCRDWRRRAAERASIGLWSLGQPLETILFGASTASTFACLGLIILSRWVLSAGCWRRWDRAADEATASAIVGGRECHRRRHDRDPQCAHPPRRDRCADSKQTCIRDGVAERCGQKAPFISPTGSVAWSSPASEPGPIAKAERSRSAARGLRTSTASWFERDGRGLPCLLQPLSRR